MAYLKLTITDTLGFWDDELGDHAFNPHRAKTFTGWYRVPDDWLAGDSQLLPERRRAIFAYLYGPRWTLGNDDGSKYIVLHTDEHLLSEAEAAARPWHDGRQNCYQVGGDGAIAEVGPDRF